MKLSARNQFTGTIKSIKMDEVMAEIVISVGDLDFVAVITASSATNLSLKVGDAATAIIKSTEVMVAR